MNEITKEVVDRAARHSHVEVREMGEPAPGTERNGQ